MPQEFMAIIREPRDTSQWIERTSMLDGGMKRTELIKSAQFLLESSGPFPWPPEQLAGKRVRVIIED